jgi:hypothetical protein
VVLPPRSKPDVVCLPGARLEGAPPRAGSQGQGALALLHLAAAAAVPFLPILYTKNTPL